MVPRSLFHLSPLLERGAKILPRSFFLCTTNGSEEKATLSRKKVPDPPFLVAKSDAKGWLLGGEGGGYDGEKNGPKTIIFCCLSRREKEVKNQNKYILVSAKRGSSNIFIWIFFSLPKMETVENSIHTEWPSKTTSIVLNKACKHPLKVEPDTHC